MGADLYIKKLERDKQYTGFRTSVDLGYFRDAYNNSDLLWQYDLSWWDDIMHRFTTDGDMSVEQAKTLLAELEKREPVFKKNMDDLLASKNRVWDYETDYKTKEVTLKPDPNLTPKKRMKWVKEYQDYSKVFKAFLKRAIDLDSPIDCSL